MPRSPRVGRVSKRLRTRDGLLVSVQELLLEKPASEISIREITDRAGVVHATFYNYYPTTAAAFEAVSQLLLTAYGRVLEQTLAELTDPVERVAASARQTMRIVSHRPRLGKLLFDSGLGTGPVLEGIRARVNADIRLGIEAGRFKVNHLDLVVSAAAALGLGVAIDVYEGRLTGPAAEGVAEMILSILGVPEYEVQIIVGRPLAQYEMPALPLSLVEQTLEHDG